MASVGIFKGVGWDYGKIYLEKLFYWNLNTNNIKDLRFL